MIGARIKDVRTPDDPLKPVIIQPAGIGRIIDGCRFIGCAIACLGFIVIYDNLISRTVNGFADAPSLSYSGKVEKRSQKPFIPLPALKKEKGD